MRLFSRSAKRRKRVPPDLAEWRKHRDVLRWFERWQTSLGCYHGRFRLEDVQEAISYFAHEAPEPVEPTEGAR